MGRLENKIAMVTGAARGNGEGISRVLAKEGATVVLTDILDLVQETAESIVRQGNNAISFKMDVTKTSEVTQVVQSTIEKFGRIDILVNNAGIIRLMPLVDMPDEIRDRIFDINIKGAFTCSKAVLPSMMAQKYGKIINISSVSGPLVADQGECAYAATKAALWGFTRALAFEAAPHGINVNAVCPGWILTEMARQGATGTDPKNPEKVLRQLADTIPLKRLGTTEEVGAVVAFLASDEAKYITGTPIIIDGGSTIPEGVFTSA